VFDIVYRYDRELASARARPSDAADALRRLDEGSRSLAALLGGHDQTRRVIPVDPRDLGLSEDGAPVQRPFAAVLGCSDARVPIELVFNVGPNDLFVVRVAGNGLGPEGMGSLKYAADHLGDSLKLVVVLGHSGCGAVTAAVDVFLEPQSYLALADQHALRNILDRLLVVVHAGAKRMAARFGPEVARHPRYREALVEIAVVSNAALAAYTVESELRGSAGGLLRAAYGVWLLESREIWAPRAIDAQCAGLAAPPADAKGFARLADAVVGSARITAMLA
jgi:carbonic anhydrase